MNEKLIDPVQKVVLLLVGRKFSELAALTHNIRLSGEEIAQAVASYGKELVFPPEEGFRLMDVVAVKNAEPPRWSIAMPLWTREEGRSDLTLEITVIEQPDGFSIELDDLHVL